MKGNYHIFADRCWALIPPLLLAGGWYLGISQGLSYTLYKLPRGFPIALGISQWLSYTL